VPDVEVLIKEARQLRRRRWSVGVGAVTLAVLLVISGLLLASSGSGRATHRRGAHEPSPAPATAAIGQALGSSSLGAQTTIVAGSMLSASRGFALAAGPHSALGYVVETNDAGRQWRVRGLVPFSMRRYFFVPAIQFLTTSLGYVESDLTNGVYVTRNGGRSWRRLEVPGHTSAFVGGSQPLAAPSFTLSDARLFLLGQQCKGTAACRPLVAEFGLGASRPARVLTPPAVRQRFAAPTHLVSPAPGVLALFQGAWGYSSALFVSRDDGETWSRGVLPCGSSMGVSSVVTVTGGAWILSCFHGEGMTQGLSEMWRSNDTGSSWYEVAVGNMGTGIRTFGNLPDAAALLGSSNDGRLLWGLLGSAAGGVMVSTDEGASWKRLNQQTGESWDSLAPAGAHGVVVFTPGASLWSTDGTRFIARRLGR
jgi:photosystem II stability/assembly factor-like uncharacterized protein